MWVQLELFQKRLDGIARIQSETRFERLCEQDPRVTTAAQTIGNQEIFTSEAFTAENRIHPAMATSHCFLKTNHAWH